MAGKRANRRKQAKSRLSPLTNSQILDELDNLTTEESTSHEPFPALVLVDSQDISDGQASTFENGDFKISVNQDNPTTPDFVKVSSFQLYSRIKTETFVIKVVLHRMILTKIQVMNKLMISTILMSPKQKKPKPGTKGRGGRPKEDKIWDSFLITKSGQKRSATCKDCGEKFGWAKVERLRTHVSICHMKSPSKKTFLTPSVANTSQRDIQVIAVKQTNSQTSLPQLFRGLEKFKDKWIPKFQKRFLHATYLFSVIEHPEVIKALRMLNPSYKPPSSKTLGGPLLDKVYNEIVSTAKEKAQSKFATLMQDGWSGLKQAPVISHCINVEGRDSIFVNAISTTNEVKDAEYCANLAKDAIEEAEENLAVKLGDPKKIGGLQTVLPKRTRWNTQYSCLENFAKNHTIYLDTAKDVKAKTPPEISDILTDLYFYQRVTDLMKKMAPVTCAITKQMCPTLLDTGSRSRKTGLSDIPTANLRNAWIKPSLPLFALHIYSIREGLPTIFRERGQVWLAKKNPLYESVQLKLEAGDSNYFVKRLMNKEILRGELALTSSQWWDIMGSQMENKLPIGFAKLAKELMMLPASTSGMERCFSTMGIIISKTRNRIEIEKASKLCMIYRTLNCGRLEDKDIDLS
ncbi:hypothetical protein Fcan01_25605 [Folsomia candida]|uniref:HAT C-terminal dimerisation domain-containing protein n=1 Tax=Folsomia candida TaxID=158441 RepID=A0A226D4H0_FOLCA|nr:hypothetical protein Fcan01_25605 [Folsomia candida]